MEVFVNVIREKQPVESIECDTRNEGEKIVSTNSIILSVYYLFIAKW